jgi:hypothetical protein
MPRGLTDSQIERLTRELLARQRRVTVRDVMQALRTHFGGCGRTERICKILKRLESEREFQARPPASEDELSALLERVRVAEARAALSEERERQHQDLWAARYAEKIAQLDRRPSRATHRADGVTHEQYLRVYQRAAELARRLAKYEDPDKPLAGEPSRD